MIVVSLGLSQEASASVRPGAVGFASVPWPWVDKSLLRHMHPSGAPAGRSARGCAADRRSREGPETAKCQSRVGDRSAGSWGIRSGRREMGARDQETRTVARRFACGRPEPGPGGIVRGVTSCRIRFPSVSGVVSLSMTGRKALIRRLQR